MTGSITSSNNNAMFVHTSKTDECMFLRVMYNSMHMNIDVIVSSKISSSGLNLTLYINMIHVPVVMRY